MFNHQVASTWAPNVSFVNSRYHFMGCTRAHAQFNSSNKNLTLISTNGGFKKTFADSNIYFNNIKVKSSFLFFTLTTYIL
jgi:hypothetical protein